MTEYIDLDTPLEVYVERGGFCTQRLTTLRELLDINKIPYKAANVRPVVTCADCKHYQGVHNCHGHAPCDYWGIGGVLWNDFCSRGVKMEEN